jgi:hypothetical protein
MLLSNVFFAIVPRVYFTNALLTRFLFVYFFFTQGVSFAALPTVRLPPRAAC